MSVPSSTILPRSNLISGDTDDVLDFDGAAEILRAWGAGLTPDPDLTVSEWADRHRMLSGRASAEPGRYRTARSRDAGNTMLSKEFAGGILIMTGANSAVGLRSTPARYIFLDEVDAYPASVDEEGDSRLDWIDNFGQYG